MSASESNLLANGLQSVRLAVQECQIQSAILCVVDEEACRCSPTVLSEEPKDAIVRGELFILSWFLKNGQRWYELPKKSFEFSITNRSKTFIGDSVVKESVVHSLSILFQFWAL